MLAMSGRLRLRGEGLPDSSPRSRRWLIGCLLWAAAIHTISSIPSPESPIPPPLGADKVVHVLMFFPLAFLAIRWRLTQAVERGRRVSPLELVLVATCLFVFAACDELHQEFVPGRSCDLLDWLADVAGILLGMSAAF
ncbi:MAG: VanZ family protein, partial [Deltaproteobacteria bacterium]|nr:VanZ family protein [Deltaproteobacteria bacterium]